MSDKKHWTFADIPNQTGKVAIVTGANSGVGYETARALAKKGSSVIMACRDLDKAYGAAGQIRIEKPHAEIEVMQLDLGDIDLVRAFVAEFNNQYDQLDILVNNAGVMHPPYGQTNQGFETQFGVNHLGHFALTGLLLDVIRQTPASRIVTVSSLFHMFGRINFDNLNAEMGYSAHRAYSQSKLANLLFTYELQRKLESAGSDTIAVAAHPGWSETNLQQHSGLYSRLNRFVAQSQQLGALPILQAATAPDVLGGYYYGPGKYMGLRGYPKKAYSTRRARDGSMATRLWAVSEELTGIRYSFAINEKRDAAPAQPTRFEKSAGPR